MNRKPRSSRAQPASAPAPEAPKMSRRGLVLGALAALAVAGYGVWPGEAEGTPVRVYKSPSCGCCGDWVDHMRGAGFSVTVVSQDDVTPVKDSVGVPPALHSCHTAVVDDGTSRYVLEGHVPAAQVRRLLDERPNATGLAVPGMPIGSPGMEQGSEREPYAVMLFGRGRPTVFARY